jgi:lipopolysaccharide/colanic/teichoic acid biosynthesis glycosyltransferase
MQLKFPSSRGHFRVRFSTFDLFWAATSPLLALYLRDAYILSSKGAQITLLYCGLSLACSMVAFLMFRLSAGVSRYFSVHDALNVVKAAVTAGLLSSLVLFTFNRLDGIPRSTPLLQVLILAAGLLAARTVMLLLDDDGQVVATKLPDQLLAEHIIMIGSTRLSSLYIRFLRSYCPDHHRIVAVLDHTNRFVGRAICGVPVVSLVQHLEPVIEEFAVHGVRTDRVIIGGNDDLLSEKMLSDVRRVCGQRDIALDFVPELVGLQHLQKPFVAPALIQKQSSAALPPYYRIKRLIDFFAALAAIITLSPLFLMCSVLVLFAFGSPAIFWQQRVGRYGRSFLLYKFRTLRAPFDWHGHPVPAHRRISALGILLRDTHLDELPQLFNVLVGDMSLVGPRPLLPHDQPTNASQRLSVRPGITGWAQINGGNLVTMDEKGALDDWYVRHISLWLDLRIALLTLRFLFTGERRSKNAISEAQSVQHAATYSKRPPHRRSDVRDVRPTDSQTSAALPINATASNRSN